MTATAQAPTAIEMSKQIIDQVSQAVASGGDAAQARAALAEVLRSQGGAMAAGTPAAPAPAAEGLTCGAATVRRPNGQDYHVRRIGIHEDVALVRKCREKNEPILAFGEPGTGKTALIEAALSEPGKPIYTVQGTGDTEWADFVGGYNQLPDGTYIWVDGPLLRAMEEGGVLYVDESPIINPVVMAGLYPMMDGRDEYRVTQNPERGVVKAKPGFYIISACNPNAPGARMSEALLSRFSLQFKVTTDFALAKRLGVSAKMVTAAQNMQRKLDEGKLSWAPQMRELLAFKSISELAGEEIALRNIISSAPEISRPQVQELLSRAFSKQIEELRVDA